MDEIQIKADGRIVEDYFIQFGSYSEDEKTAYIDLQFRMATNGIIVNTIVNSDPVITTSAGLFN